MTQKTIVYLASPYTHRSKAVQEARFHEVKCATSWLIKHRGLFIYSPILHCHQMALDHSMPTDFVFWMEYNKAFIRAGKTMLVLEIDGWKESRGVAAEIAFCSKENFPISYVLPIGEGYEIHA